MRQQPQAIETYPQINKLLHQGPNLSSTFWDLLPNEILFLILSFITDPAELARFSQVSKFWEVVTSDDGLWKKFWIRLTKKEEKTLAPEKSYKHNYAVGGFRREWHSYAKRNAKFLKTPQIANEWRIIPSKKNKFLDLCETGNKQSLSNFLKDLKPTDLVTKTFGGDESDIEQINQALVLALNNKNNGRELFRIVVDFFEAGDNPDDQFYLVKFLKKKNRWILYQKYKDRLQVTHKKMFEAVKNADIDLVEFLLSISPNNCLATVYGHTAILNYAFDQAITEIGNIHEHAITYASNDDSIIKNRVAIAKLLLNHAKTLVARDGLALANYLSMDKLLHNSVTILHFEFFKLLIDNGAQLTARRFENNLFHRLAELLPQLIEDKYEDFCKILEVVSQKPLQADVDAVNDRDETPVTIALRNKNTKVLEKFIELQAGLDAADIKKAYAEIENSYEVKYLLLLLENRSLKFENRLLRTELKVMEKESLTQSNVDSPGLKFN